MKVLILNGSPRAGGNSEKLIREMTDVFDSLGADYEVVSVGNKDIRGCIACGYCSTHDGCVFGDIVSEVAAKLKEADGLVLVSPVYYASPNGTLISLLDRLFHSRSYDLRMKIGAAFAIARRGGTSTAFDVLNKYFTISGMPVASGDYWNNGFGREKGEIV
ncbi:MAG: flavodoxin family protein, partial [Clostridia bacterium]|nr:flavodoxin family protein [Clostridia bacterium]